MKPAYFLEKYQEMSPDDRLAGMVEVLTGPEGCPWDQKQTALSMVDYVIDEAHELKESLLRGEGEKVGEELGDFLFTVEFLKQRLASQASTESASLSLVEKMVRRHPHVFSDTSFANEAELKRNWETEKHKEGKERRQRLDHDLPASLPPLKRAVKVLSRAMNAGFRYLKTEDAFDKVWEEFFELEEALLHGQALEEELGDVFLALLTVAKMQGCSADNALAGALQKFCDRLQGLEELAGRPLEEIPHGELRGLYAQAKSQSEPTRDVFLNYCGVSPWPRTTRNAVRRATHKLGTQGLPAALELLEQREQLKPLLRELCGAPEELEVCLVPNVSNAALGVAYAQNWEVGDKILLGKGEFPANTVPWKVAAKTFGLETIWFDDDAWRTRPDQAWVELEELLREQAPRVMAVSAVAFWSGFRVDLPRLGALCRQHGVRLYVDAIQGLGNTPTVWAEGVDYFAGGSHKALLSPEGAGFLLVHPEAASDWQARLASWLSLPEPIEFLVNGQFGSIPNLSEPREGDPTTLQGSSLNSVGYEGLKASVGHLLETSPAQIFERVQELHDLMEPLVTELGWESLRAVEAKNRSAILSFKAPSGVELPELQTWLSSQGVSVGIPNGVLRFGFHEPSSRGDVLRVVECLRNRP